MFTRLGYAGNVELQEGSENDALDMKNYGIKILVKFRSTIYIHFFLFFGKDFFPFFC